MKKTGKTTKTAKTGKKKGTKRTATESNFYYGMGDDGWGIHDVTDAKPTKKSGK